jgi:hypothetical protein
LASSKQETLGQSTAKYKFVFAHYLTADRGGTDTADLFEWGGYNRLGEWQLDKMRPDWDMPIHQLMVKTGVTVCRRLQNVRVRYKGRHGSGPANGCATLTSFGFYDIITAKGGYYTDFRCPMLPFRAWPFTFVLTV